MIFVTVGTQKFQFDRLLKAIDINIENGLIDEEVFAQVGTSNYSPHNYKYIDFLQNNEFQKLIKQASIIVTHSGVGTIIAALKEKKTVVVVPRLSKYGEHIDDHQIQIAKSFEKQNMVIMSDEKEIDKAIKKAQNFKLNEYISNSEYCLEVIRSYIFEQEKRKKK